MSEEEKKAIKWLEKAEFFSERLYAPIILNLIEKQQKEISRLQNIKRKDIQDLIDNEKVNIYKNYISKDKIRELKQSIHNTLDENGITRGYQQIIDKYFDELLEENNND